MPTTMINAIRLAECNGQKQDKQQVGRYMHREIVRFHFGY